MATLGELRRIGITTLSSVLAVPDTDTGVVLDVDVILQTALSCNRAHLLTRLKDEVSEEAKVRFESLLKRRSLREPIAYLTGVKEFYGYEFSVSPAVLIPRPETEILVERALEILAVELENWKGEVVLVDIGVGSGAILLSVLKALQSLKPNLPWSSFEAIGVDVSPAALQVAEANRRSLEIAAPVRFVTGDLLTEPVTAEIQRESSDAFFLILSNPPYIGRNEELMPDVRLYEPEVALYGGEIGTEIPERLLFQALPFLSTHRGRLLMEIGHQQADELVSACNNAPFEGQHIQGLTFEVFRLKDLLSIDRVLEVRRPASVNTDS